MLSTRRVETPVQRAKVAKRCRIDTKRNSAIGSDTGSTQPNTSITRLIAGCFRFFTLIQNGATKTLSGLARQQPSKIGLAQRQRQAAQVLAVERQRRDLRRLQPRRRAHPYRVRRQHRAHLGRRHRQRDHGPAWTRELLALGRLQPPTARASSPRLGTPPRASGTPISQQCRRRTSLKRCARGGSGASPR